MKSVSTILIGIVLILTAMNTAYAVGYSFNAFDFPLAYTNCQCNATVPLGINNAGTIVGWYSTGVGLPTHAFIQNGSTITSFDYFNAFHSTTYPNGINDAGTVVGDFEALTGYHHGFTLISGIYTYFHDGPLVNQTSYTGINGAGSIVGINCNN